jgi:hypothetical protein
MRWHTALTASPVKKVTKLSALDIFSHSVPEGHVYSSLQYTGTEAVLQSTILMNGLSHSHSTILITSIQKLHFAFTKATSGTALRISA